MTATPTPAPQPRRIQKDTSGEQQRRLATEPIPDIEEREYVSVAGQLAEKAAADQWTAGEAADVAFMLGLHHSTTIGPVLNRNGWVHPAPARTKKGA